MKTITANHESAKVASPPADVSVAAARNQVSDNLATCLRSNRDKDGFIHDPEAIHEIACLTKTLKVMRGLK